MEKIPNPTIEFYPDNHVTMNFKTWDEWYDRRQKEAKEYIKCRHKAEIVDAASQYEL